MSSALKNLSSYNQDEVPSGEKEIFGIVVSEWNNQITDSLLEGAVSTLLKYEVDEKDIDIIHVPGSFELPFGAANYQKKTEDLVPLFVQAVLFKAKHVILISFAMRLQTE